MPIEPFPDGAVWVRTEPVTFLSDHRRDLHAHDWHQFTFALRGQLEVETAELCAVVPPECAVWVPAGQVHRESMWAPVAVRTVYLAPGALGELPARPRTVAVSPLLRELLVHVATFGSLDRRTARHAHLLDLLLDLVADAPEVDLVLPFPRDPRARRLADALRANPGSRRTLAAMARATGASLRTLERCFRAETGLGVGEWRRRQRLLEALRHLRTGAAVSEVAEAVGYANPSAFTAAFTRFFGAPPTQRR